MHHFIKHRDYAVDHPGHSPISKSLWTSETLKIHLFLTEHPKTATLKISCAFPLSLSLSFGLSLSLQDQEERRWRRDLNEISFFCFVLWCRFVQFWSSVPFEASRFGLSHCCAARVSHRVGEKLRIVTEMSFKKSEQGGRGQRLERRRWRRGLGWRRHELLSALSAAPGARAHQCVLSLALSLSFSSSAM